MRGLAHPPKLRCALAGCAEKRFPLESCHHLCPWATFARTDVASDRTHVLAHTPAAVQVAVVQVAVVQVAASSSPDAGHDDAISQDSVSQNSSRAPHWLGYACVQWSSTVLRGDSSMMMSVQV